MLGLPRKTTTRVDVVAPMRAYLTSKYSKAEVERHMDAVNQFQALRSAVGDIQQANDGSRVALRRYFEQLNSAAEKFPVSEAGVKINFSWSDTFRGGDAKVSQCSWAYERASVLFNMAAIDSQIAVRMDRSTPEEAEKVRNLFVGAASTLVHVRDAYASKMVGSLPLDLTVDGLNLYISVLLAQSQSIYYEIARAKGMKAETNAKLAGGAADLYRAAARALPSTTNPSIVSPREVADSSFPWSYHCDMWACIFDGASFFQYSDKMLADAEATGTGYGVRVAWLYAAEAAAGAALGAKQRATAAMKGKSKEAVQAAHQLDTAPAENLLRAVRERKEEAEAENKRVYREVVPRLGDLPELPRATLAKTGAFIEPTLEAQAAGQVPPTAAPVAGTAGAQAGAASSGSALPISVPLFAGIVPAEVARAMGELDDRLQAVVASAKEKATAANAEARQMLSALKLPGCLSSTSEDVHPGVPPSLWDKVHACQRAGGAPEVERLLQLNASAITAVRETLRQAGNVLDEEASRDSVCRSQHGSRWTALPSSVVASDLRADLVKYRDVADRAIATEEGLRSRVEASRAALASLSRSRQEMDASVPAGAPPAGAGSSDPQTDALRRELLALCEEVEAIITARLSLPSQIPSRFDRNGAAVALMQAPQAQHGEVLDRLLTGPNPALQQLEEGYQAQARVLASIQAAHARFNEVRSLDERTRARQAAIQSLTECVDKYEELLSNAKEGQGFWGELRSRCESLLGRCKDMATARATQQMELLMTIQGASPASSPIGHGMDGGYGQFQGQLQGSGGGAGGGAGVPLAVPVSLGPTGSGGGGSGFGGTRSGGSVGSTGGHGYGESSMTGAPPMPMGGMGYHGGGGGGSSYDPFAQPMPSARSQAGFPSGSPTHATHGAGQPAYAPLGYQGQGYDQGQGGVPNTARTAISYGSSGASTLTGSMGGMGMGMGVGGQGAYPTGVPVAQPVGAYGQQQPHSYGQSLAYGQQQQPQYGAPQPSGGASGGGDPLSKLVAMGFQPARAEMALRHHNGNLEMALNQLIAEV